MTEAEKSPERLSNTGREPQPAPAASPFMKFDSLKGRKQDALAVGLPEGFYLCASTQLKAVGWFGPKSEDFIEKLTSVGAAGEPTIGDLEVVFVTGARWKYAGVPKHKALGLLLAPSAGRFFGGEIKAHPAYTASKIADAPAKKAKPDSKA